jgi:dTDP-L-rhamnose 4-epimerase
MGQRMLVVGGAGFIGSHLVDALLARGDEVRVLDNLLAQAHPSGAARFLAKEAELMVGDVRDRPAVERALASVSVVFHLAGMVGNGQSMTDVRRYADVNVVGTATLLEAMIARCAQFRRLVVASSMVVYGDGAYACDTHGVIDHAVRPSPRLAVRAWEPVCPRCGREVHPVATHEEHALRPTSTYGISKLAQEQLALVLGKAHRLPTIALRYLNTYGSRQALTNPYTGVAAIMVTRLLNDRPPTIFEDGKQLRDFTHVSDVVRATLAAEAAGDEALYLPYNIGRGQSVPIVELARALGRGLGKQIEPHVTGEFRDGDIRHCFADVSRARARLGWQARVTFEEGISELVAWASGECPEDATEQANAELRERQLIR